MTDILHLLPDFPIQPFSNIVPSLEKHNITVTDLLTCDAADLAKRSQVPVREVRRLTDSVLHNLQAQLGLNHDPSTKISAQPNDNILVKSGVELLSNWQTISLLDDGLDAALGGGIPSDYLTEITGERCEC